MSRLIGVLFGLDMPFVPGIPDHDIVPIVCPGHVEKVQATIFKQSHAIVFYSDLRIVGTSPFAQHAFRISIPHDHYVQGLCGPEIAYGHSV